VIGTKRRIVLHGPGRPRLARDRHVRFES
jgi:hypothetical protein